MPLLIISIRYVISEWRLSESAATVARPVGVRPRMRVVSGLQQKWSLQRSRRGLKRATIVPSMGSGEWVLFDLRTLHPMQA